MGFWPLFILFSVFLGLSAILIFFILMQKGKGEGLAGLIGGAGAADGMGTPEAQKELSRYTAWLAGIFFFFCLMITLVSARCGGQQVLTDLPEPDQPPATPPVDTAALLTPPPATNQPASPEIGERLAELASPEELIGASPEIDVPGGPDRLLTIMESPADDLEEDTSEEPSASPESE
jgi:protein translocase SecG subunit